MNYKGDIFRLKRKLHKIELHHFIFIWIICLEFSVIKLRKSSGKLLNEVRYYIIILIYRVLVEPPVSSIL